jgi:hypothetical protein
VPLCHCHPMFCLSVVVPRQQDKVAFTQATLLMSIFYLKKKNSYCKGVTISLFYKRFMMVIYECNDTVSTTKLNYDHKALTSVVNYDHKRNATIWIVNLTLFTIVICLSYRPQGPML